MLRARQQLPDSQSSFFSEPAAGNFVQGGRGQGMLRARGSALAVRAQC